MGARGPICHGAARDPANGCRTIPVRGAPSRAGAGENAAPGGTKDSSGGRCCGRSRRRHCGSCGVSMASRIKISGVGLRGTGGDVDRWLYGSEATRAVNLAERLERVNLRRAKQRAKATGVDLHPVGRRGSRRSCRNCRWNCRRTTGPGRCGDTSSGGALALRAKAGVTACRSKIWRAG